MTKHKLKVREYAELHQISIRTVKRWIEKGAVKIERTPSNGIRIVEPDSWITVVTQGPIPTVYIVSNGPRFKIGFSTDPVRRIRDLQLMSGARMEVLAVVEGSPEMEHELHARFAKCRAHGEWFDRCAELDEFLTDPNLKHLSDQQQVAQAKIDSLFVTNRDNLT